MLFKIVVMARIRTIKPEFFKNEELAELPVTCRLLFIGLFCLADKEGRMEDRPKRIKAELFPYDNIDAHDLLSRLQSAGFIERYEVGEMKVIQVVNFTKHQRIQGKESLTKSEFPARETTGKQRGNNGETPEKHPGNNGETFGNTGKEGKGKEGKGTDKGDWEIFLIPRLHALWLKNFPNYTQDKKNDYAALGNILQFMLDQHGGHDPTDTATQELVLGTLQAVADVVKLENFWSVKPLKSIANNIQEFYNKIKTPQSGKDRKQGVTKEELQSALNKRLAEQRAS